MIPPYFSVWSTAPKYTCICDVCSWYNVFGMGDSVHQAVLIVLKALTRASSFCDHFMFPSHLMQVVHQTGVRGSKDHTHSSGHCQVILP